MEQLLTEIAKQVPALAVLVWIVMQFLAHIQRADDKQMAREDARNLSMQKIADNFANSQREMMTRMTATIDANTAARAKHYDD